MAVPEQGGSVSGYRNGMKRALLFDLDGTLANTDPLHYRAWAQSLAEHDLHIDEDFYRQRISGRLNPDIVADLLPHLHGGHGQAFVDEKEHAFRELATNLAPLPGVSALLEWAARENLPVALVTNAPRDNAHMVLRALRVQDAFHAVVLAEELPRGKPSPDPYLEALRLLDVPAGRAVAFEDSPSGVKSAVSAGIETVGLSTGHDEAALTEAGAVFVIPDFTDERLLTYLGMNAPA